MEVHLFGATSSPACSNFALRKTAEDNINEFDEEVVETVKKNFYVDYCLKSVELSAHAVNLAGQLRDLLSRGVFRLHKWPSNRPEVMATIPESERASSVLVLDLDKERLPVERSLGLRWDMQKDMFIFSAVLKDKPNTRRDIVSDKLDLRSTRVPGANHSSCEEATSGFMQQKLDWADPVGENENQRWQKRKEELPKLSQIAVKRCVKPADLGELKTVELHNFADASQFAFGAVSYLRLVVTKDNAYCSFLMGISVLHTSSRLQFRD